jgi:hypothetical protein
MPLLPKEFADLEPFESWIISTERERLRRCGQTPYAEVQRFYKAASSRVEGALQFLGRKPLADLTEEEGNLLYLCLSYVEAAVAVEMYQASACDFACPVDTLVVCNEPFEYRWRAPASA